MADPKPKPEITDDLNAALTRLGAAIEANPTTHKPTPQPPAKIIQFPLWPEPVRGMPNPVLRSALFSAVHGKDRRFLDNQLISSVDGVEIRFTGKQLNQEDLEVCAEVFHLARAHPLGDTCHSAAHGLLKTLGRKTGNSQHKQLHNALLRLQAHGVEIKAGRYTYFGSLIMEGVKDDLTRHYLIKINPKLAPLFQQGWPEVTKRCSDTHKRTKQELRRPSTLDRAPAGGAGIRHRSSSSRRQPTRRSRR
jgi:hypothetical protein